jgi:hypothetical protein
VTAVHLAFLVFAVANAHHATLLVLGLLFFLAVVEVTEDFQRDFSLRPPILVGFFLAGLVIHGGLQQWWIAPVLGRLSEVPLMLGAALLTAVNDNAAITYLATLVPNLTGSMKVAVVAGAVAGGGLTVIANAPNPAGFAILKDHFEERSIGALGLFAAALAPTLVAVLCFRGIKGPVHEIFDWALWAQWFAELDRSFLFLLILPFVVAVIGLWSSRRM